MFAKFAQATIQAEDDDEGIVVYVYGCRPDGTGPYCNMQSDYEMSDQHWGWFFQRSFFDQPAARQHFGVLAERQAHLTFGAKPARQDA